MAQAAASLPRRHHRASTLTDPANGAELYSETVRFGARPERIDVVNPAGRPLAIDKSLKLVETFDTRDAAQVEPLLDAIDEVLGALDEVGVDAFLAYGTALGAIRDGGLIGHDSDADLGYVSDHDHPVDVIRESFRIQRALTDMGYRVTRYSAIALKVHVARERRPRPRPRRLRRLHARRQALPDGRDRRPVPARRGSTRSARPRSRAASFPVPADTDRFLTATYGPSWRTPDPAYKFTTPASTIELLQRLVPRHAHGPRRLARLPQAHDRPARASGLGRRPPGRRAPPRPGDLRRHRVRPRRGRGLVRRPGDRRGRAGLPALRLRARGRAPRATTRWSPSSSSTCSSCATCSPSRPGSRGCPGPRAVGCVHVVERLGHRGRLNMLRAARMMVAGTSGALHLQFLSERGRDGYARRTGARKPLDPAVVLAEVAESGGRVLECVREHVSDDPDSSQVCRMIIDWNSRSLRVGSTCSDARSRQVALGGGDLGRGSPRSRRPCRRTARSTCGWPS